MADNPQTPTGFDEWKASQEKTNAMLLSAIEGFGGALKSVGDALGALKSRADAEDEKAAEEKRADARKRADSFKFSKRGDGESDEDYKARHDAEEKACADAEMEAGEAEEKAADKARKRRSDAESEEEKERADAARADSEKKSRADSEGTAAQIAALRAELAAVKGSLPLARSDEDAGTLATVQARADSIYTMIDGSRARAPMLGESVLAYRRSFLEDLKKHSARYKDVNLAVIAADEAAFKAVEAGIYEDAKTYANDSSRYTPGELRPMVHRTDSGHTIRTYAGDPLSWMAKFAGPTRQFAQINDRPVLRNAGN